MIVPLLLKGNGVQHISLEKKRKKKKTSTILRISPIVSRLSLVMSEIYVLYFLIYLISYTQAQIWDEYVSSHF